MEIERGLAECASKRDEAIDLEADEAASSGTKRSQEMPPPIAPKAKKAPTQLGEPTVKIEKPEVKARPKMPEKEKRRDYESEGEKKKQRYDYESLETNTVDRKCRASCCVWKLDNSNGRSLERTDAKDCSKSKRPPKNASFVASVATEPIVALPC